MTDDTATLKAVTADKLIERLADGPSYALDIAIAQALVPQIVVLRRNNDDTDNVPHTYRCFTTKTDDAGWLVETLLPGWAYGFDAGPKTRIAFVDPHDHADRWLGARYTAEGPSPAIALCIALLRSLSDKAKEG